MAAPGGAGQVQRRCGHLRPAVAARFVAEVRDMQLVMQLHGGAGVGAEVQLMRCLAIRFDEVEEEQSWAADMANGRHTALQAMRQRAVKARGGSVSKGGLFQQWQRRRAALKEAWRSLLRRAAEAKCKRQQVRPVVPTVRVTTAASNTKRRTAERIGMVSCGFADLPVRMAREGQAPMLEMPLERVALRHSVDDILPARSRWHAPTNKEQRQQRELVAAWGMERIGGERAVFSYGPMRDAIKAWRQERPSRRRCWPPRAVLRRMMQTVVAPTPGTTTSRQLWSLDGAPLDEVQLATIMGVPETWLPSVRAAAAVVTPTQMHALLGQALHWKTGTRAANLATVYLGRRPRSVVALGAGLNLLGAAAREAWGRQCQYVGYAEANEAAAKAHTAFWAAAGEHPHRVKRAERAEELPEAEVALATLRCNAFSPLNRGFPKGVWAALAELHAVAQGWATKGYLAIIYENTAGIWREPWLRLEIEARLPMEYSWVPVRASPSTHDDYPLNQDRVVYVGTLRARPPA